MHIINHGTWSRYTPSPYPKDIPANVLFCSRDSDGKDWYELVREKQTFADGSAKMTVYDNIVRAVYVDESFLFPQGCMLLEQADFGGRFYNAETNTLEDPPVVIPDVPASSAKLVLADDGIYEAVEDICVNHPVVAVRIYWTTAATWQFNNPYVQAIGAEMNLSAAQMVDMFRRAALK